MILKKTTLSLAFITVTSVAAACNIPVFRYALERWRSDSYEVVVTHANDLTTEQIAFVKHIEDAGEKTNVTVVHKVDASAVTPQVVVQLKMASGRVASNWRGTIEEAKQVDLLDSPARKELINRLLAGESVVWLLLRSTDSTRSDAARERLNESFRALSTRIALPEGIGEPGSELHSEVPLLVKFSAIEIDAHDEREKFLSTWLRGFRSESVKQGEPLIVPVFGRGRALEVIPASELNTHLIEDLTLFLSGACSCQVKEQNPGFDLLLTVDWDNELFGADGPRPPTAKTIADRDQTPRTLTIPPGGRK